MTSPESTPTIKRQNLIDESKERSDPTTQVSAKIKLSEKTALYALIKAKGCDGLTQFLRLLAKSERVEIKI